MKSPRKGATSPSASHRVSVRFQHRGAVIPPLRRLIDRLPFTMKLYVLSFVVLPLLAFASPVDAPYMEYVAQMTPQEAQNAPINDFVLKVEDRHVPTVEEQIQAIATLHGINPQKFLALVKCENLSLDPNLQSNLRYNFSDPKLGIVKGTRERSYGLLQIHAPSHPGITMAQMTSAEWSLNWGAEQIAKGNASQWKICSRVAGL